jgi:hypothetical protein
VSGYGLGDWAIEVPSSAGAKDFLLKPLCPMGTVGLFPGVKLGRGVTVTIHPI